MSVHNQDKTSLDLSPTNNSFREWPFKHLAICELLHVKYVEMLHSIREGVHHEASYLLLY